MSIAALSWAKRQRTGSATMKAVLMCIADYADQHGCAWPSQRQIAFDTELTDRTIRSALAAIEERGFIRREERLRDDGSRSTDRIHLLFGAAPEIPFPAEAASGGAEARSGGPGNSQHNPCGEIPGGPEAASGHEPSTEQLREQTSSLRSDERRSATVIPMFPEAVMRSNGPRCRQTAPLGDDLDEAIEAYNAVAAAVGWPRCQKLTNQRRSALRQRLRDCDGINGWRGAMAKAKASRFLTGHNDRGWMPDLDFFLQVKSFTRLMEGGYDQRIAAGGGRSNTIGDAVDRMRARLAAGGRIGDLSLPKAHEAGPDDGSVIEDVEYQDVSPSGCR